jgi:hypothetical protein
VWAVAGVAAVAVLAGVVVARAGRDRRLGRAARRQVTMPVPWLPAPAGTGQDGPVPVVPPKLRRGSSVRVIAPSRSLAIIGPEVRGEAGRKLAALGLRVSFGEHVGECDDFSSSPRGLPAGGPACGVR